MALVADMAFGHLRECRSLAVGCGVVGEIVRYTYRLRPGARAERALMAEWHRCRWLWNEAVGAVQRACLPGQSRSLVCLFRRLPPDQGRSRGARGIGIDWGVSTVATTTDPAYDLPYAGYRKRCTASLAQTQRRMARRRRPRGQAQSNGYRRAKREAAKIQKKAARQNTHAARVWARRVVDHHRLIAVEDFRPRFLAKSTMARKAADSAIGTAKRELIERGVRAGRTVVLVPPACTTMTCSECGEKQARLGLAERTFQCPGCGYTAGRDRIAARVILATAERGRAGADDVRHSLASFPDASAVRSEPQIPQRQRGESLNTEYHSHHLSLVRQEYLS